MCPTTTTTGSSLEPFYVLDSPNETRQRLLQKINISRRTDGMPLFMWSDGGRWLLHGYRPKRRVKTRCSACCFLPPSHPVLTFVCQYNRDFLAVVSWMSEWRVWVCFWCWLFLFLSKPWSNWTLFATALCHCSRYSMNREFLPIGKNKECLPLCDLFNSRQWELDCSVCCF